MKSKKPADDRMKYFPLNQGVAQCNFFCEFCLSALLKAVSLSNGAFLGLYHNFFDKKGQSH
jgi:hypothetical protein